jgi:trimeric autotransporter adhesin
MQDLLRITLVGLFISQLSFNCFAQIGIISTYAGPALPANGALATIQAIDCPSSVASDGAGGFYVASYYLNTVYRVSADGKIALIAGTGVSGFSGDGKQAASAQISYPNGLAVDSSGNLFIADSLNNRIRKVSSSGIIITVAGNGTYGYSGDGTNATSAQLANPSGVSVDSAGNLFIADTGNNRIRKVSLSGIITTTAQLSTLGIAIDSAGNLFTVDPGGNCIRKISTSGTIISAAGNGTFGYSGDGGPATAAELWSPYGIAVDSMGNLFIADTNNQRIRKVSSSSGIIVTIAGSDAGELGDGGQATSAVLNYPFGVAVDSSGDFFIADTMNNRIRKVSSSGIIITVAGNGTYGYSGDGGQAASALLNYPRGAAMDAAGNLFVADTLNNRIRKVSFSGIITTMAGNGDFGYGGDGGQAVSAQLAGPTGVVVDSSGNLFIADCNNYRVRKMDSSGIITTVAGNGTFGYSGDGGTATSAQLSLPKGVSLDSAGNLFVADALNNRIRKVSASGIITTVAGGGNPPNGLGDGGPATSAILAYPLGVAVDSAGNLFISDTDNNRIRKVNSSGIITTAAGNGSSGYSGDNGTAISAQLALSTGVTMDELDLSTGIAMDSSGNLFIVDNANLRIRKVSASGIITTVAGNGSSGYSGDGGLATSANLNAPSGIALDSAGNLFIADTGNSRIRKVSKPKVSTDLAVSAGGAGQSSTVGGNLDTQSGYATVAVNSGAMPYGTAVFSFKQSGVTVSETGVPASPPTVSSRVFIDYRAGVYAVPGRSNSGVVDVNTGIAVVNRGTATANVTYTLRDGAGSTLSTGHGTIAAGKHFSCFIGQLKDVASDFNFPANFQTAIQFGALDIVSDQPLSVLAIRGTMNQRQQFIITTTPVADLTRSPGSSPIYFAQLADGGGYTTSLILMNTSSTNETGTIQLLDNSGNPLTVNPVGGTSGSSFNYSIPPNGIVHFQTDGSPTNWKVGWVKLTPDSGTSTPIGSGIFGYNPANVLITESGVPSASGTTHARIYVDLSGNHNTGLAIANIGGASSITLNVYQADGVTPAGTSNGPLSLAAYGHDAKFAGQFITGLPDGFTGLLDVSSTTPFAALTVRSLMNENNDYLITTFPVADVNQTAPSPIVFPQIADGGGYMTQFIFLGASGASITTVSYFDNNGAPLAVGR